MTYTLITGASKGIGKSMAIECAKLGMNLILVARSMPLLEGLKQEITKDINIDVQLYAADLAKEGASAEVYEWCSRQKLSVDKLINNAGVNRFGSFDNLPLSEKKQVIQLNVNAVIEMTHYFLPDLLKQREAHILIVGSTSSFIPNPYMALYGSSKAFIYSFSRALRSELKRTNVSVSCLCPGPTKTDITSAAGMKEVDGWKANFEMSSESVARSGILGMLNKKAKIVPGFSNKLTVLLSYITPTGFLTDNAGALMKSMGK